MDISTVVTAILSSGAGSLGAARWLTTHIVDQRLAKDLKDHQEALDEKLAKLKADLDTRLATAKAETEATLRIGVEEYLGDKTAERQYQFDARKRLYAAIGPLRFQLITASVNFANRINRIGDGNQRYATSLDGYFGRSTVFRLLRLFAIAELIERQVAYADFSVDPSTMYLLRFKETAFRCLSSSSISLDHPDSIWDNQVEHIFYGTLSMIAATMVVEDSDGKQARAMRFDEFNSFISNREKLASIRPVPRLMENFTTAAKPILWVRFVALAQLCSAFVTREGPSVGVAPEPYDGAKMLRASTDEFLNEHHKRYCEMLQSVSAAVTTLG
jgi:hypothetical protein